MSAVVIGYRPISPTILKMQKEGRAVKEKLMEISDIRLGSKINYSGKVWMLVSIAPVKHGQRDRTFVKVTLSRGIGDKMETREFRATKRMKLSVVVG